MFLSSVLLSDLADQSAELAAFEGIPSKTEIELDLMTRYFVFLVIVSFSCRLLGIRA